MQTMTMREFLRGGYKKLGDVTVVTSKGYPKFTVFPSDTRVSPRKPIFHTDETRDSIPPGPPGPSPNGG